MTTTTRGSYSARLEVHAPMTQAEKQRMDASDARDRKRALACAMDFIVWHQIAEAARIIRLWQFTKEEVNQAECNRGIVSTFNFDELFKQTNN